MAVSCDQRDLTSRIGIRLNLNQFDMDLVSRFIAAPIWVFAARHVEFRLYHLFIIEEQRTKDKECRVAKE